MERDDLIVNDSYALNAHHSEEEGVAIRKKNLHGHGHSLGHHCSRSRHGSDFQEKRNLHLDCHQVDLHHPYPF